MLGFFGELQIFLKFDNVTIENNVFKLHYKVTVMILMCASLIITSGQYIGDPINCMSDGAVGNVIDTYCWISSTFSIPEKFIGKQGVDNAYAGVAPIEVKDGEPRYHKYYQWVALILALQAGLFYLPRYIWKSAEEERLKMLVEDMNSPNFVIDKEARQERIDFIVNYYKNNQGCHVSYSLNYFFCEILNLVNVIGQIFLMDRFLGGEFSLYGLRVFSFTETESRFRPDPMAVVFPKVTKCSIQKYGSSGSIENYDALCVLPLNIINEKIFVFLWFWFLFLASITGIFLVYRFLIFFAPGVRAALIMAKTGRSITHEKLSRIIRGDGLSFFQQIGDFFLLYLISKNVDEVTMKELMMALYKEAMENHPRPSQVKNEKPNGSGDPNVVTIPSVPAVSATSV